MEWVILITSRDSRVIVSQLWQLLLVRVHINVVPRSTGNTNSATEN